MIVGFLLLSVNTWQLSHIGLTTPLSTIGWILALRGVALGIAIQPTLNVALSVVNGPAVPRASSLGNASRQVAQAFGVAILGTILQSHLGFPPQAISGVSGFHHAYGETLLCCHCSFAAQLSSSWLAGAMAFQKRQRRPAVKSQEGRNGLKRKGGGGCLWQQAAPAAWPRSQGWPGGSAAAGERSGRSAQTGWLGEPRARARWVCRWRPGRLVVGGVPSFRSRRCSSDW